MRHWIGRKTRCRRTKAPGWWSKLEPCWSRRRKETASRAVTSRCCSAIPRRCWRIATCCRSSRGYEGGVHPAKHGLHVILGLFDFRHATRFVDSRRAGVEGSEDEGQIALIFIEQLLQECRTCVEVLLRVQGIVDLELFDGRGHELHEPGGALRR